MVDRLCSPHHGYEGSVADVCNGGQHPYAAKQIAKKIAEIDFDTYVEPFEGHGNITRAVMGVMDLNDKKVVLNDKSCKRMSNAKKRICSGDQKKCAIFKKAQRSCGKDYKQFLKKYDKDGVVMYLDPPYETVRSDLNVQKYDLKGDGVPFDDFIDAVKQVKHASVLVSYTNTPEYRKVLCNKPFKCTRIQKYMIHHRYTELLAIIDRS